MTERFSKLLNPACIKLALAGERKEAAIEEVARLLDGQPGMTDFQGFYRDLLAREELDTTCFGYEIAVPHGRTTHVSKIMLAIGRSDAGVSYPDSDEKVRLIFVLGTPKSAPDAYLSIISAMCRLLHDRANRDALLRAPTPDAFIKEVVAAEEKLIAAASVSAAASTSSALASADASAASASTASDSAAANR
jgi:mannitol/fructose-specific phosphotransferase system IIA component (Ntr-type)